VDRAFAGWVAAVGLLVGAMSYLSQRHASQFFADDFLYLQLARAGSLTPDWLAVNSYGHFTPANRLVYLTVQRTIGLDYSAAALLPTALVVTIFLSMTWLCRELLGGRLLPITIGALGATSVPVLRTMLWFGSANHVLGAAAMMTLCVAAFVVYSRRGLERYRLVSVLALTCGLLIQERPMITIGYLVLIRYLLRVPPRPPGRRWSVRTETLFWFPWAAVEGIYVVYRLFFFEGAPEPGNAHDAAEFIWLSVIRGWASSLVGVQVSPANALITPAVLLGLATFVAFAVVLVLRREQAWRALLFFAAIYLANMGIVAVGRLNVTDLRALATDLQYYVDVHLGTLLAFVLGFSVLPRRAGGARRQRGRLVRFVIPVAALALVVSTVATFHEILGANNQTAAHGYLNRAQAELHDQPGDFALMRTKLPLTVAPSFIAPYTDVTTVFSLDREVAPRLRPTSRTRLVILADGSVVPAHPSTLLDLRAPAPGITAGLGTLENTGHGACLSGAGAYYEVRIRPPMTGPGYFFAVTYTSSEDRGMLASVRGEQPAYNWGETELPAGKGVTVVDRIEGDDAQALDLGFTEPVSGFCLTRVWIGRLAATVDGTCRELDDYGAVLGPAEDCTGSWDRD
jgi:hypothetical protein